MGRQLDWFSLRKAVKRTVSGRVPWGIVEDVTQEVVLDLLSQWLSSPPTVENVEAYARVVAINKCKASLRAGYREQMRSLDRLLEKSLQVVG